MAPQTATAKRRPPLAGQTWLLTESLAGESYPPRWGGEARQAILDSLGERDPLRYGSVTGRVALATRASTVGVALARRTQLCPGVALAAATFYRGHHFDSWQDWSLNQFMTAIYPSDLPVIQTLIFEVSKKTVEGILLLSGLKGALADVIIRGKNMQD